MNKIHDPFIDNTRCISRLYDEYKKHPRLIIACDFDHTLFDWDDKGYEFPHVFELLERCQRLNFYIVLFSASAPERHEMMKAYMADRGINVASINKNPIDLPYGNHGKIYYNILLCDRAGLKSGCFILNEVLHKIEHQNKPTFYLEAPNTLEEKDYNNGCQSVFLGGSITGANDWQKSVAEKLLPHYHVFNPHRENFDVNNPEDEELQITWEYEHLNKAHKILFWFSFETFAPITLFELGAFYNRRQIFIGIHPEYKRKNVVVIQMKLRGITDICYDLDTLVQNVVESK